MIQAITVYETKGKQFKTLQDAIEHRESLIEEFFRKTPGFSEMPASARIPFVESIIANRRKLIDLLDYSDKTAEDQD